MDRWKEDGFARIDALIDWARANQIYVILDLHAAPGGQGTDLPIADRDPDAPSLWDSAENQRRTVALWRKLAARYADEPWVGGYDILNEPNWDFRSEEHTSELQSLMRISYAVFCLKKTKQHTQTNM